MSKTELRRQSIYTWMLITFTAIMFFVMAHQSRAGTANWDGDNATGNFSYNNNWYGDVQPTWGFGNQLQFNYRNNASQTSIYWDYGTGTTWYNIDNITFMNTFAAPITWNGNGGGLNFNDKIENQSSQTITFGTMNFSGGKNGATAIELNPVNGDMIFSGGNLYNDNSLGYKVFGGNSKMLTLGTTLGVGTNAAKVGLNIEQYSKVYITAAQSYQSNTAIKTGELWIGTGGSLNTNSRVDLGLTDTNTAKFYLTGGVTNSNSITVLSTNTGGVKVLGGLSASGTNVFAGNVTNNNTGGVWLENTVAGGTVGFTGVLSGTGSVTVGGLGTVNLASNNTFSGNVYVKAGTLSADSFWTNNSVGVSSLGNHATNTAFIILDGGTLKYTGTVATNNMYGIISVGTNGGTLENGVSGTVIAFKKGTGGMAWSGNDTANRTMTFSGTGLNSALGSTAIFNGALTNGLGGGVLSVVKSGTGNWSLTGANTFTGGLEIRQGSLIIANSADLSAGVGSGDVKVFNDAGIAASGSTVRVGSTNTFKLGGTNYLAYVELPKVLLTNNTIINNGTNVFAPGGTAYAAATANFNVILGSTNGVGETGGSYSLTKMGGGVLTLNGTNSYSGGTIMNGGVLNVTNTGTLGTASSAVTLSGGTLDLGAAVRTNGSVSVSGGTLQNGSFSATTVNITGGTIASTVTNTATTINISGGTLGTSTLSASSAFNYGGGATGISTVALSGAGRFNLTNSTLTLSDNFNTLTGGIGLTGGTLTLTNASNLGSGSFLLGSAGTLGTLQVNTTTSATNGFVVNDSSTNTSINVAASQTFTMSGTISQTNGNNNATKFGKDGAGTLVMAGSNGTYGGQLQIGQGTVVVGVNNALGTNVTTSARGVDLGLNVGDTAQANNVSLLISNGVTFGQSIYVATNLTSATRTIGLSGTGASGSFTNEIYQDGDLTLDAGSSTGTLTVSGAIVTNNAAVAKGIIVTNGTTVLSGNNNYTGKTTISSGTLKMGSTSALGAGSTDLTVGTWLSGGNLDLNGQNLGSSTETLVFNSQNSYITNSSTTTAILGGTMFLTNSTANTFAVDSGKDINFTGSITNGSASRVLVKNGGGTLTLSGTNGNNGQINVNGGTLKIGNVSAMLGSSTTTSNIAVAAGATLDLNGYTLTGLRTITNAGGTLANSASGATTFSNAITMTADSTYNAVGNLTLSGAVGGAFGLTKSGAGILTLSGTNSYLGTTVNAGKVVVSATNNLGNGAINLAGGILQETAASATFNVGAVTFGGSGELQLAANGKFVSTGAVTVTGSSNLINLTGAYGTYTTGTTNSLVSGTSVSGAGISLTGTAVNGATIALGSSAYVGHTTYTFQTNATAYQLAVTGGGTYNLTWNPATSSGNWNTNNANTPWINNADSQSTFFFTGDNVTLGSAATIAVDAGGVTAGTMAVTNSSGTVTLSGGAIGASSLTKSGAGTVTMSNALTIAGALTNSAGTLSNDSTTAANSLAVSGGSVSLNGAASITNGVVVSGGTLALNGANTISGGVTNTGGTLLVGNNGALGNNTLFVSNNGVLGVTSSAMTLLTNAVTVGVGGATVSNSVATTLGGAITNVSGSANLTLTKDGSGALTLTNALGATGNAGSIALNVTNGNLVLSGAQKFITNSLIATGAKLVLDGVTVNTRNVKIGGAGTIEVTNNSTLSNSIGSTQITNQVTVASGSKLSVGTSSSYYVEFQNGILGLGNFTAQSGGTNRITGNNTIAGMTIDSGGTVSLINGVASNTVITNNGTLNIQLSSGVTNYIGAGNSAHFNGNISGNGTISANGSQNFYLDGNISGSNNISMDNNSSGNQVFLTGSNSFTGGITFANTNAGSVWFGNSNALGTGTISNNTSANAQIGYSGSANTADYTFANAIVTGTTNTAILSIKPGVSNNVRLGGVISGSGNLKLSGSQDGTLYLNNSANTYSGGTEIGTGKIGVGSDGAFGATTGAVNFGTSTNSYLVVTSNVSFNASRNFTMSAAGYTANIDTGANAVTINGTLAPTSTGGNLNKIGTGSLTLAGAASYTGTTTLTAGTLNLGGNTITNTALTITAGTLTNGSMQVSSAITVNGSSTNAANLSGAADFTLGSVTNITVRLSGSNSFSGLITLGATNNQTLEVTGTNALSSAASLQGSSASARTPTLSLLSGGAYKMDRYTNGNVNIIGTNASTTTLTFTNTSIGNGVIGGSRTLYASNVNVAFTGGLDLGANAAAKYFALDGNGDFAFNSEIINTTTNSSSGALKMMSTGTLTLAASNSFDGGVIMNAGTVAISNNAAFGTGLVLLSNSATVRALTTLTVGNNYSMETNKTATFDVGSGLALTNSGVISGSGAINKTGAGTLHLTGANSYSNGATVTGGTLAGDTGSLIGNITNNATVEFVQATAGTYSNVISGSGAFRKSGEGELTLNQANTFSGGATITAGTLKLNRAGNGTGGTIVGTIAVNGGTLLLGQANQISDSSAVTLGGGTINTGGFADQAGVLTVSANSAISGLVATTGGAAASATDFLFSSVSLTNYATSSGATLDLGSGYTGGATINFANSNYTGWTGYSTTSINNFADKIQFGNTGLKAQINFNGTTGLTYITAIPEPKVYVAMAMLVALVGVTEYKRRKRAVKA